MRTGPLLAAAALLVALAGCVPTTHPSASLSATATPVFASDAEALAAAEKAYAAYLKVSDEIGHDGGRDPDRIASTVTSERLTIEKRGSTALQSHGLHTTGFTRFSNASLEQVAMSGADLEVIFYACWNASEVRVINAEGADVTPGDRVNKRTLEVVVTSVRGRLPLVLESDDAWSGRSSC
jgi:hypothetical protein